MSGCVRGVGYAQGVATTDDALGERLPAQARRAAWLFQRGVEGDLEALDRAVKLSSRVLGRIPREHRQHTAVVILHSNALIRHYETRGEERSLGDAVRLLRAEVREVGRRHPRRVQLVATLGWALLRDAELTGVVATMDEAVRMRREAVASADRREPAYLQCLADLGGSLAARAALTASQADLIEAVKIHSIAVRGTAPGDPLLANRLSLLGFAQMSVFEMTGDATALQVGLDAHRRAVASAGPVDPMCMLYSNLGIALGQYFEQAGDDDLLDESIAHLRMAVDAAPPGRFDRPRCLISLATAFQRKFEVTGDLEVLNAAVDTFRQAIGVALPSHPQYARGLCGLAGVLILRYMRIGDSDSLDEALWRLADGVAATPEVHPNRPDRLSALACARYTAFSTRPAMFAQITEPLREALALSASGHVRYPFYLSNLGAFRNEEYELTRDPAVLEEALDLNRAAVEQTPIGHTERGKRLANWGVSLANHARIAADAAQVQQAVEVCQTALDVMGAPDPNRSQSLLAFANALVLQAELTGDAGDDVRALAAYQEAASDTAASTLIRIRAAHALGQGAATAGDAAKGLEGFATAVGLIDQAAWRGLDHQALVEVLGHLAALPEDAAALAIETGQPHYAVELLEEGRGVLLARTLDDHISYDQIHEQAPALAEDLARVIDALARIVQPASALLADRVHDAPELPSAMDQRTALAAERDELIEQIRRIPGLEDLFLPPRFAALQSVGAKGPVVMVNVSTYRCDALAITPDGLKAIPLADLTLDKTVRWGKSLQRAVTTAQTAPGPGGSANAVILEVLAEIWDTITSPVLEALGISAASSNAGAPTRIWWCPTGPATALPLHAAGHHQRADQTTTLDRVTSSYTPTIRALQHQRRCEDSGILLHPEPLIVAMPSTAGQRDLPGAQAELDYLASRTATATVLSGERATLGAVTRAMPDHAWVHFSCHGQPGPDTRSGDRLLLHDEPLTARQISTTKVAGGMLAVLSACKTYDSGDVVPDECLTIGSALQLAGYQHVIATQWPVYDRSTAALLSTVYDAVLVGTDGDRLDTNRTAEALRAAMIGARRLAPQEPARWVPYIHLGPS